MPAAATAHQRDGGCRQRGELLQQDSDGGGLVVPRCNATMCADAPTQDGHWANDYGGPMFLLPGLVVTCYITGTVLPEPYRREMIVYLSNIQAEVCL